MYNAEICPPADMCLTADICPGGHVSTADKKYTDVVANNCLPMDFCGQSQIMSDLDFFVVHRTQSDIGGSVRCMSAESPCMSASGINVHQSQLIFSSDFGGLHRHVSAPDTTKISKKPTNQ